MLIRDSFAPASSKHFASQFQPPMSLTTARSRVWSSKFRTSLLQFPAFPPSHSQVASRSIGMRDLIMSLPKIAQIGREQLRPCAISFSFRPDTSLLWVSRLSQGVIWLGLKFITKVQSH